MKKAPGIALSFLLVSASAHISAQDIQSPTPEVTASNAATKTTSGKDEFAGSSTSDRVVEAQKSYESGLALYDSGKFEDAILALKESTKLRPDDAQTHFVLGMAYAQSKAYKDAADSFKKAVRYKADWPEAHFRFGMMSYVLGRRAQSVDSYRRLLSMNSPLANVLFRIIKDTNSAEENAENIRTASEYTTAKLDAVTIPASMTVDGSKPEPEKDNAPTKTETVDESALTSVYRIGVGDVLDIRFLNASVNRSSLYTVIDGGLIDMPLAGGAVRVAGLTAEELQKKISAELKRRAVEQNAQVSVGIRHYGSHTVIITGLVGSPGTKILRREAVPLYVILAEVQPRLDAARAAIMRAGALAQTIDLNDSAALGFLIRPGDVINITSRPQEFYYIAGRVNSPGQKSFQSGITLLQGILAAGGTIRPGDNDIELSREGENGLLSTTKISLKDIKSGKIQDPKLRPGDRIVVTN